MADTLTLIGFEHSVYTRILRMALIELGMVADYIERNPFADDAQLDPYTPLCRVPVLRHGDFTLTETGAILRYLARIGGGDAWLPQATRAQARMDQVISVVDAHLYWPCVRQVFSHGFYAPLMGEPVDPGQVAAGLAAGAPALRLLDDIAGEGLVLATDSLTAVDLHLAPMIDYFTRVDAGVVALAEYPALMKWWAGMSKRPSLRDTDPFAGEPRPG